MVSKRPELTVNSPCAMTQPGMISVFRTVRAMLWLETRSPEVWEKVDWFGRSRVRPVAPAGFLSKT